MTILMSSPTFSNALGCVDALLRRLSLQRSIFIALICWAAMGPFAVSVTNLAYGVIGLFVSLENHPTYKIGIAGGLGMFYVAVLLALMHFVPIRLGPKISEVYMKVVSELYALQDFLEYQLNDEASTLSDPERTVLKRKIIDIGNVIEKIPACATSSERLCGCTLTRENLLELVKAAKHYLALNDGTTSPKFAPSWIPSASI